MDIKNFQIKKSASLQKAMVAIEKNTNGIIFIIDDSKKVIGSLSDGDIRTAFIQGKSNTTKVTDAMNKNFVSVQKNTRRSKVLKMLELKLKVIPELDKNGHLVYVHTAKNLPLDILKNISFHARSPVRVSFCGGGSDTTTYFENNSGAVMNATLSIYSHASLIKRADSKITVHSKDLKDNFEITSIYDIDKVPKKFDLLKSIIKLINPNFGFDLYTYSDYPMKSGLGGSAVVLSSIIGCFNEAFNNKWDKFEVAELAFQAERLSMGIHGGWQDQYATTLGGFNLMEFKYGENVIHPVRIPTEAIRVLESSLVLCSTSISHESGQIHEDQKNSTSSDKLVLDNIKKNVSLCYQLRESFVRGNVSLLGKIMHEAWTLKKTYSSGITNEKLDEIYNLAINHGAEGGKLLGAGGGGYFLFFVPFYKRIELMNALSSNDLFVQSFKFEKEGLVSWQQHI